MYMCAFVYMYIHVCVHSTCDLSALLSCRMYTMYMYKLSTTHSFPMHTKCVCCVPVQRCNSAQQEDGEHQGGGGGEEQAQLCGHAGRAVVISNRVTNTHQQVCDVCTCTVYNKLHGK